MDLKKANFTNLTYLCFTLGHSFVDFIVPAFDKFMQIGLQHMTNVKKFIIHGHYRLSQDDVLQIVKTMKHLCILNIGSFNQVSKQFYLELVEARKVVQKQLDRSQHKPITIEVDRFDNNIVQYRAEIGDVYNKNVVKINGL